MLSWCPTNEKKASSSFLFSVRNAAAAILERSISPDFVVRNLKGVFDYLVAEFILLKKLGLVDEVVGACEPVDDREVVEQGPRDALLTDIEIASSLRFVPDISEFSTLFRRDCYNSRRCLHDCEADDLCHTPQPEKVLRTKPHRRAARWKNRASHFETFTHMC